ncbi:hypothetical protein NHQ30_009375 [Ciborinia camelliae]|nr:hypothetical protein NHQ30_009375 [Ciborinia camelliae]
MCLRAIVRYEYCGQRPYSWIVRSCRPQQKGTCNDIHTTILGIADFCPDCYLRIDPRPISLHSDVPSHKRADEYWEFDMLLLRGDDSRARKARAIFDRAQTFLAETYPPDQIQNLGLFSSHERMSEDVYRHLWMVLNVYLQPYLWFHIRAGRGAEVSLDDRMIMLQLREAWLQDTAFDYIERSMKRDDGEGKWRSLMGAQALWISTLVENPPDEPCPICQFDQLPAQKTISLPCGHMFHEECLGLAVNATLCPMCRRPSRGPMEDVSMPLYGPMPAWLDAIAPFHRHRNVEEMLAQPPPTLGEIARLERAFEEAQDQATKMFEEVLENMHVLAVARQTVKILEEMFVDHIDAIEPSDWDKLNAAYVKMPETFQEEVAKYEILIENHRTALQDYETAHQTHLTNAHNLEVLEPTLRLHQWRERATALEIYRLEKTKHQDEEALEGIYAKCLPMDLVIELRDARMGPHGEDSAERILHISENLWRDCLVAREEAADALDYASFHRDLHRKKSRE